MENEHYEISEKAIVIKASNRLEGIQAEYEYIESALGLEKNTVKTKFQIVLGDGLLSYDLIGVELPDGTIRRFLFNITSFYRKNAK